MDVFTRTKLIAQAKDRKKSFLDPNECFGFNIVYKWEKNTDFELR